MGEGWGGGDNLYNSIILFPTPPTPPTTGGGVVVRARTYGRYFLDTILWNRCPLISRRAVLLFPEIDIPASLWHGYQERNEPGGRP
jgi:hypothetical protein